LEKYLKWADVLILVFSIIDSQTFVVIQEYLESICDLMKKNINNINNINNNNNNNNNNNSFDESSTTDTNKMPTKLILLGNKLDLERYRQVPKPDVDALIEKYSYGSGNNINMINNKLFNSDPTNHALITEGGGGGICLLGCLNVTYMETTSCEEYELVQNLFHKIIRDVRRERETHHLVNPLQICEEIYYSNNNSNQNANTNTNNNNNNNNNNSSNSLSNSKLKSKSSSSYNSSSTIKRSKSPKHNSFNMIQDLSQQNLSGSHNQLAMTHASNGNSLSASNFQALAANAPAAAAAASAAAASLTTSSSSNGVVLGSVSGGSGTSGASGANPKEINKKNSSKFPFFTKILNKS
jgi:hypothetical protein